MAKHTPGPWRIANEESLRIRAPEANDATVATITQISLSVRWDPETVSANARLIAAAPDLLEACRMMIAWNDAEEAGPDYGSQTRDTHPDGEQIWQRWWDDQLRLCARAFDTARAAIAKATEE